MIRRSSLNPSCDPTMITVIFGRATPNTLAVSFWVMWPQELICTIRGAIRALVRT